MELSIYYVDSEALMLASHEVLKNVRQMRKRAVYCSSVETAARPNLIATLKWM
jgi:hypothetical protein